MKTVILLTLLACSLLGCRASWQDEVDDCKARGGVMIRVYGASSLGYVCTRLERI